MSNQADIIKEIISRSKYCEGDVFVDGDYAHIYMKDNEPVGEIVFGLCESCAIMYACVGCADGYLGSDIWEEINNINCEWRVVKVFVGEYNLIIANMDVIYTEQSCEKILTAAMDMFVEYLYSIKQRFNMA